LAKISPEVLQAIADLDSGRAYINTLNVGNSPEAMFAQYANTGLSDALGYLHSASGYFNQGKADESIASTYAGLGARELAAAAEKINEARGNMAEASARLQISRTIQAYEQSGNQKLALYRQELRGLKKAPDGKRYPKD
jgi:5-bromo-4-chloroindolyl phosphate hydrolysis protein